MGDKSVRTLSVCVIDRQTVFRKIVEASEHGFVLGSSFMLHSRDIHTAPGLAIKLLESLQGDIYAAFF